MQHVLMSFRGWLCRPWESPGRHCVFEHAWQRYRSYQVFSIRRSFLRCDFGKAHMIFDALKEVRPQATEHCGRAGEGKRTADEIGVASLRMGGVVGVHEVHICTDSQCLTLRHEARDRGMFADGGVAAARYVANKPAGLYNMKGMLEES